MADNSSGGIGILGVLVGALIVLGVGFFVFQGMGGSNDSGPDINIEAPSAPAPQ